MSDATQTAVAVPEPAQPKATRKPRSTPKAKVETKATGKPADRSMADVPAAERRLALLKLLKKVGATSETTSRPIGFLADKLKYSEYDVYCLCYHKYKLATDGLVRTAKLEGARSLSVFITAKGLKSLS